MEKLSNKEYEDYLSHLKKMKVCLHNLTELKKNLDSLRLDVFNPIEIHIVGEKLYDDIHNMYVPITSTILKYKIEIIQAEQFLIKQNKNDK